MDGKVMYKNKEVVKVYVDGSYKYGKAAWAFVALDGDTVLMEQNGIINDPEVNSGHQIGGECQAVLRALAWAAEYNKQLIIYFDYVGLKSWIADLLNPRLRPWATNKKYTAEYRRICLIHKDYIKDFVKVKGHSGDKWNDYVDKLAAKAYKKA